MGRHNTGWHVTIRVAWLASVGGCAFSPQPLLHTIPSVSRAWIVVGLMLAAPSPARAYRRSQGVEHAFDLRGWASRDFTEAPTRRPASTELEPSEPDRAPDLIVAYHPNRKFYSLNFGEFTVFFEAGDDKKGPRAMHLNRRDLDCHPNLTHPIFVFAITPNVLLFHNRVWRHFGISVISDISRWREYYASGVGCFRMFSSKRWYSDQFRCKNTRISFRCDETRTKNVKL